MHLCVVDADSFREMDKMIAKERARALEEAARIADGCVLPYLQTRGTVNEMAKDIAAKIRALAKEESGEKE